MTLDVPSGASLNLTAGGPGLVRDVIERYLTHSERETAGVAATLARRVAPGTVVLLYGALGAGKTAFVRGFVEGVGIAPDEVSSPTFTIIQPYGGDARVYHVDLYRLAVDEVEDLGLEELPERGGLVCIEWAERLPRPIVGAVSVRITDRGDNARELAIEGAPGPSGDLPRLKTGTSTSPA